MKMLVAIVVATATGQLTTGGQVRANEIVAGDAMRASVQRSIPYIEERGVWWIKTKKCVSCHRTGTMVWSLSAARQQGLVVSKQLDEWVAWSVGKVLSKNEKGVSVGAGNLEGVTQLLRTLTITSTAEEATTWRKQMIDIIIAGQRTDGSWNPGGQLPAQKRPKDETASVSTMWNLLGIAGEERAKQCSTRAAESIAESQPGKSVEWYVVRLLLATRTNNGIEIAKRIAELRSQQNNDGGWGWLLDDESDALASGMVLYTLRQASVERDDPTIQRGVRFLVDTQQPNGSWQVRGTKKNKRENVEETASYWGTTWAAIGMLSTLP